MTFGLRLIRGLGAIGLVLCTVIGATPVVLTSTSAYAQSNIDVLGNRRVEAACSSRGETHMLRSLQHFERLPRAGAAALWAVILAATAFDRPALAEPAARDRTARPASTRVDARTIGERMNANTLIVVTASPNLIFTAFGADLATVLNDGDELRILPVITEGAVQNMRDVRFLRGGARFDDLADGGAFERLADLKRRDVRPDVVHAAAHVRVDGHVEVADEHLAVGRRRRLDPDEREVVGGRPAPGTRRERDHGGHRRQ